MQTREDPKDARFIARLEACSLGDGEFGHPNHVRAAWIYLRRHGLSEGAACLIRSLKRFALSKGAPERYHETITWAFLVAINERIGEMPEEHTWDEFAAKSPDLLEDGLAFLRQLYRPETLDSGLARRVFLLPDLGRSELELRARVAR